MKAEILQDLIAKEYGIDKALLIRSSRASRLVSEARRMFMLLLEEHSFRPTEIKEFLGVNDKKIRSRINQVKDEIALYGDVENHYKNLLKAIENVRQTENE